MISGLILLALIVGLAYFFGYKTNSNDKPSDSTALSVPASASLPPINKCELKEGWYFGALKDKKPGTPDDWFHVGEGGRSAKWRAPHEPRDLTAEEAAECEKATNR